MAKKETAAVVKVLSEKEQRLSDRKGRKAAKRKKRGER